MWYSNYSTDELHSSALAWSLPRLARQAELSLGGPGPVGRALGRARVRRRAEREARAKVKP